MIKISDVRSAISGISDPTIRLILRRLPNEGLLEASSSGPGATWHRIS